jgi:hypothetical protein
MVKISKTNCSLFYVPKIYTLKVQICYETFVLICHHSGTFLIRILCPKIVKIPQNCLLIIVFIYIYNRSKYVMHYHLHLFTIMYNYSISFITFCKEHHQNRHTLGQGIETSGRSSVKRNIYPIIWPYMPIAKYPVPGPTHKVSDENLKDQG